MSAATRVSDESSTRDAIERAARDMAEHNARLGRPNRPMHEVVRDNARLAELQDRRKNEKR
jgi:hypothetical protein